jgi:hypothetical protein
MHTLRHNAILSLAAAAATLGCGAAWAGPAPADCGTVTGVQRRIVEHADEGWTSLRSFVQLTTVVHGINMSEVRGSLDTWRATVTCQKEVAAAKAASETAKADDAGKLLAAGR